MRWFAAEFLVVVTGVLVALALNAWWGSLQDAAREREYLEELHADLNENAARLQAAIASEAAQRRGAEAAYRAVASGRPIPRDSALAWVNQGRAVYYSDPRLLTGTVRALISTGDLRLLQDPRLRQAVAAYEAQIREDREEFDRAVSHFVTAFEDLRAAGFAHGRDVEMVGRFPSVISALTGQPDREVLVALDGLLVWNEVRVIYLRRMLDTNARLQALVER